MNTANFELMQQIAHEQHQMLLAEAQREQLLSRSNRAPTTFWNKIWRGATGLPNHSFIPHSMARKNLEKRALAQNGSAY